MRTFPTSPYCETDGPVCYFFPVPFSVPYLCVFPQLRFLPSWEKSIALWTETSYVVPGICWSQPPSVCVLEHIPWNKKQSSWTSKVHWLFIDWQMFKSSVTSYIRKCVEGIFIKTNSCPRLKARLKVEAGHKTLPLSKVMTTLLF